MALKNVPEIFNPTSEEFTCTEIDRVHLHKGVEL